MKAIGLCADDYAQHAGIDDAVCELAALGRLTAVSCMADAPRWAAAAPRLRELDGADIGLHLNLTEGFGTPRPRLPVVIGAAYLRQLDATALRLNLARQFDAFEAAMGRAPDFVDGHQHVHQLPQVAAAMLEQIAQRYPNCAPWVRNTVPLAGINGAKPAILRLLGGASLARRLRTHAIATNTGFGGVYGFNTPDYAALMDGWLAHAQQGALLMCHPGCATDPHDAISAQRLVEYAFLTADAFPAMLAARHTRLVRLSSLLPQP